MEVKRPYAKRIKPYLIAGLILGFVVFNFINFIISYQKQIGMNLSLLLLEEDTYLNYLKTFYMYLLKFHPFSFLGGLLTFLACLMGYTYNNDKGIYRLNEEHGSARYATEREMEKFADTDDDKNMIISRNVKMGLWNNRLPYKVQKNKHVLVIGDSGSSKTLGFVKPNIMQMNGSFLCTDPKGLIVHETGKMLEENGYKIKVFDLNTLMNSDQFNVFKYIKKETDVDRVLEQITEGTKKSDKQEQDFWIQAEAVFVRSMLAFLWFDSHLNGYKADITMIADMIRLSKAPNRKSKPPIDSWFDELEEKIPGNYATKQWRLFEQSFDGETRASVTAIAAARYSVFDHQEVKNLVSRDTMDIESWIDEKTAVFISIPETNSAYNFLASIFISTVMETLRFKIDSVMTGATKLKEGQKLLFFQFFIDEFANIGRIPNIDKALATYRSRNMGICIMLQALAQLKAMYKDDWASIVNNCATLLFLGGDEKETTEYLSKRIGKQTINIRNRTKSKGRNGGSESHNKMARDLLTPDEIGRLEGDECLVFITKEHVFRDKKLLAFQHKRADEIADDYEHDNWYVYKRYKDEIEEIEDNVIFEDIGFIA